MLRKRGATHNQVEEAAAKLKELPDGVRGKLAAGFEAVKSTSEVFPKLVSHDIDLALLKIAYEYLALHLGSKIFQRYFDDIRSSLIDGKTMPACCSVIPFRVRAATYRPFHGIRVKNRPSGVEVKVLLFGYLSYHVHFANCQITNGRLFRYLVDLSTERAEWTAT